MAELLQKDVRTINEHIKNILADGEQTSGATIRKFRIVQIEGKRGGCRRMNHGRHERDKNGQSGLSGLAQKVKPLVEDIVRIQKQAKAVGIFVNDRELLECAGCDLVEDEAFDGSLMTYHRESDDMTDSGLRFEEMDENKYRCPVCGTVSKAEIL
jgi:hypothetical protein